MDALTTMLDSGLPLTAHERDELGDPAADPGEFAALAALCPYHALGSRSVSGKLSGSHGLDPVGSVFPPVLVTTAADDARVPSWGPAKFVARLRRVIAEQEAQPFGGPVLLNASESGGHGAGLGSDAREAAARLAFLLGALGSADERAAGWGRGSVA